MKMLKKSFSVAPKVDKGKSKSKPEERIAKRVKLRPEKIAEIDEKEKKSLFGSNFGYSNPSNMRNKLNNPTSEINKHRVDIINIQLTKLKNRVKNVPNNDRLKS